MGTPHPPHDPCVRFKEDSLDPLPRSSPSASLQIAYFYNSSLSKPHYHSARKKAPLLFSSSNFLILTSKLAVFVILCLSLNVRHVLGAGKQTNDLFIVPTSFIAHLVVVFFGSREK